MTPTRTGHVRSISFDSLTGGEQFSLCWSFLWRALVAAAGASIGGAVLGFVFGFIVALTAPGDPASVKAAAGLGGLFLGLVAGGIAYYLYVSWLFGARLGSFKLALVPLTTPAQDSPAPRQDLEPVFD
jgi:hypothetical protein